MAPPSNPKESSGPVALLGSSVSEQSSPELTPGSPSSISSSGDSVSSTLICQLMVQFQAYEWEPWILSTGTNVDDVLYRHLKTLTKVSALHHFVLDQISTILCCFERKDKDIIQQFIAECDSSDEKSLRLCDWKRREILRYALAPKDVWTLLRKGSDYQEEANLNVDPIEYDAFRQPLFHAMLDIATVYRNGRNELPVSRLEIWYRTKIWGFLTNLFDSSRNLEYGPGDITCTALTTLNNVERDLESKYRQGRKLDGVVISRITRLELCAIEAGRWDNGATGTKVLQDRRKLAKVLRDMFEIICNKSQRPDDVRRELRTCALLISGSRIDFVSFYYLKGRFYRMQTEQTISFPQRWDEAGAVSPTIASLVRMIFTFKERLELMSAKVVSWTQVYDENDSGERFSI
ncbi:hypothetical protein BGZ46_009867 [Entomortierella lignicola]|nr:hypothetical protein BGZ46_009867 [Entomortierella lignicola]